MYFALALRPFRAELERISLFLKSFHLHSLVDNLLDTLNRLANRSYVDNRWPSQICPCQPLHRRWHRCSEHHCLSEFVFSSEVLLQQVQILRDVIVWLLIRNRHVIQNL